MYEKNAIQYQKNIFLNIMYTYSSIYGYHGRVKASPFFLTTTYYLLDLWDKH